MAVVTKFHISKKSFLLACKICEQGNPSIAYDVAHLHEDEVKKLINLKALFKDSKSWIEDDVGNYKEIAYKNSQAGYINQNQEWIKVHNQSLTVYKMDFNWLINLIRSDLEITKYPSDILIEDLFWRVGTLQSEIPLFFGRRIGNKAIFEDIYKSLEVKKGLKKGVILTTSSNIPFGCSRLLGHEVISLKDCLVHDSNNFHIDRNIIKVALGIKTESENQKEGFSAGYRTAYFKGIEYSFSKKQAAIIEALHKHGGKINKYELLAEADSEQYDIFRVFRSSRGIYHPAWNIIIKNDGKGNYWLEY